MGSGVEEADPLFVKQFEASRARLLGMIQEIDIWRLGVLMVNRYADDAEANARRGT